LQNPYDTRVAGTDGRQLRKPECMIIITRFIAVFPRESHSVPILDFLLDKIYINRETHYLDDDESTKLVFNGTGRE
jgi:hypothetical protein